MFTDNLWQATQRPKIRKIFSNVGQIVSLEKKAHLQWHSFSRLHKSHTADYGNTMAGVGSGTIDIHNWRCVGGIVIMSIRYRCVRRCTSYPQISPQLTRPWGSPLSIGKYVGPQHSHRVSHKTHLLPVDITLWMYVYLLPYVIQSWFSQAYTVTCLKWAYLIDDLKFLSYN